LLGALSAPVLGPREPRIASRNWSAGFCDPMAKVGLWGAGLGTGDSSFGCVSACAGGGGGAGGGCSTFGAGAGGEGGRALFKASSVFLSIWGGLEGTGFACTLGCVFLIRSGGRSRYFKSSLRCLMASKGSITGGTLKMYRGIQVMDESSTR